MKEHKFSYGPVWKGVYIGLISLSVVVFAYWYQYIGYYLLFLLYLGLGLRPTIEYLGLVELFNVSENYLDEKINGQYYKKKKMELERKVRDEKYRKSRLKDPRLPKNW